MASAERPIANRIQIVHLFNAFRAREINDASAYPLPDWRQPPLELHSPKTDRIGGSSRWGRRPSRFCRLIKRHALRLSSTHNTPIDERPPRFSDDRALRFAVIIVMEVNDDPVPHPSQFMGARGVGVQRREVPLVARRVEDWKPGFRLGIKSFRRDARQNIERDLFAVFAIDIEEDVDARLFLQGVATGAHAVQ